MNRGAEMTHCFWITFAKDWSNLRIDKETESLNFGQKKIITDLHTRFDFFCIHVKDIFIQENASSTIYLVSCWEKQTCHQILYQIAFSTQFAYKSGCVSLRLTSKNLWTFTGNYSHYMLLI